MSCAIAMEKLESFDVSVIWQILYDPYMIGCWIAISFIISWRTWSNSFSAIAETRSSSSSSSSEVNGLKSISLRQDNAGCYHSAATVLGVHQLAIKHNVSMRMDFSDPQGGKGPCDRKAANIKNHMRSFLNSGHDISNAEDMQSAIQSNSGIRGVATVLCGSLTIPDPKPFPKWDGVSFINDIQMNTEGMRVWRDYGVGDGKEVQH